MMDDLSYERLRALLGQRPLRYAEQMSSTNDEAIAWALDGAPAGALVVADEQVTGRGRLGRTWYTPPGVALALSLILPPVPDRLLLPTLAGALAVARLAEAWGAQGVGIKWPNDVQVNGRKLCGILPEAAWSGGHLRAVVLGMGVNVRLSLAEMGDLAQTATNMEDVCGQRLDRARLVADLVALVEDVLSQPGAILAQWRACLTTLGRQVRVGSVVGLARDVDEDGALLIESSSGELVRVVAGDVHIGVA
ncbi:MAG: biotin--[acetyl-CoA-carboxylase] ligase [Anaerolineae bacterium]|nr:biotin--[acetyl-CoA-carboxylase] ligase [Anaerolineae bacterium]MDW8171511.1 biotin--[acetyl-CoA-carboxylase] ligase [Anaerolineae bacterium]